MIASADASSSITENADSMSENGAGQRANIGLGPTGGIGFNGSGDYDCFFPPRQATTQVADTLFAKGLWKKNPKEPKK